MVLFEHIPSCYEDVFMSVDMSVLYECAGAGVITHLAAVLARP